MRLFFGAISSPHQSECRTRICRRSISTSAHSSATISPAQTRLAS